MLSLPALFKPAGMILQQYALAFKISGAVVLCRRAMMQRTHSAELPEGFSPVRPWHDKEMQVSVLQAQDEHLSA